MSEYDEGPGDHFRRMRQMGHAIRHLEEDLPKEKLAPYEEKVGSLAEHLEKVRSSLKINQED